MHTNIGYSSLRYVLVDLIGDVIYWPLWWYSRGLKKVAVFCLNSFIYKEHKLGLRVWWKNLFVPMFGQHDIEGRLISFFARLVVIAYRSVVLIIWSLILLAGLLFWLLIPFFIYYQLVIHYQWAF